MIWLDSSGLVTSRGIWKGRGGSLKEGRNGKGGLSEGNYGISALLLLVML